MPEQKLRPHEMPATAVGTETADMVHADDLSESQKRYWEAQLLSQREAASKAAACLDCEVRELDLIENAARLRLRVGADDLDG